MANFTGGSGNDRIFGTSEADTIDGRGGGDELFGLGGDDFIVGDTGNDLVEGGDGDDLLGGGDGDDIVRGETGQDRLWGGDGNDLLGGGDGNDRLDGGGGIDRMWGGPGDDLYIVDQVGDEAIENPGVGGLDHVRSSVSFTLGPRIEKLTLTGAAAIDGTGNGLDNVVIGNSAVNVLRGEAGADRLFGQEGEDLLGGGDGDDYLDGGAGDDRMWGSHGNDVYIVDHAADEAIENPGVGGIDRVESSVSYALGARIEQLTLTGTGAIDGTGNGLDNLITGNAASNRLDGGAGADTMIGAAGNDTYVVDDAGDQGVEASGEGRDRVEALISYTLGDFVEDLTLIGDSPIDGTGNGLANRIIGNEAANALTGGGGNDTLRGGGGDDILLGGDDSDRLEGEDGNDVLDGGAGSALLIGGEGNDYLVAESGELYGGPGDDVLEGSGVLKGGPGNDILRGDGRLDGLDGNDIIFSLGNDRIDGAEGDDEIHISAPPPGPVDTLGRDVVLAGDGNDTIFITSWIADPWEGSPTAVWGDVGIDTIIFLEAVSSYSGLSFSGIERIRGSQFDDTLSSNGADVLSGWFGNDTLSGGFGAQQFFFESALDEATNVDTIVDFETGTDTIRLFQAIFPQLEEGPLDPDAFVVGTEAADADDRVVYDPSTGALFYDADGAGSGEAVQFATLSGAPALSAADFLIVTEPLSPGG